jgi:hypothetical protein
MKKLFINAFLLHLLLPGCNAQNGAGTSASESSSAELSTTTEKQAGNLPQGNDFLGEWQLIMIATDDNRNKKMDDEERKKGMTEVQDYMKLNSDGSCEFYTFKLKGRYELKTESDGKKLLVLFDKNNNRESRGTIESVTKTEMVLLKHSSGGVFSVYKRL